jgi:serine/threonine protein kinase
MIGLCAEKDPVYIVMEFMPGGAFLDFLRKKGCNQTKKKLCRMCVDVCQVRNQDLLHVD